VATVLVTLFQQQKISFTNYSWAISHISEGPKNQRFRGLLCPSHQGWCSENRQWWQGWAPKCWLQSIIDVADSPKITESVCSLHKFHILRNNYCSQIAQCIDKTGYVLLQWRKAADCIKRGWPTSTHRRAIQFLKEMLVGSTCVYIYLEEGSELTTGPLFTNTKSC